MATKIVPETLFEVLLDRIVKQRKDFASSVDGLIMFTVLRGADKGDIWTVDLRKGHTPGVYKGKVKNADVNIVLTEDYLPDYIRGGGNVHEAVEQNRFGIMGNQNKARSFANLVAAQSSALDLRAAESRA